MSPKADRRTSEGRKHELESDSDEEYTAPVRSTRKRTARAASGRSKAGSNTKDADVEAPVLPEPVADDLDKSNDNEDTENNGKEDAEAMDRDDDELSLIHI